ncbi:arf-GAP with SH3 domain, ANK repeat and PH domain-containing protein 2-like protein [Lates japonicus]|uniref:Arf-GAP with SH3 domain, ANK repeat and PH domain-containing protein 2-like protein n=1 Tax=Lates japonicus TaxID=270547 RepID=A0AAD3RGY8_LATJO|nr:arf-GAP with SH3 domain, ANK repeat and PH domain-containing protein 2-like protein [Lates japonicus]
MEVRNNLVCRDDMSRLRLPQIIHFTELSALFKNLAKIEKEKREHAKQHRMIRTEFSGGEIAEEMEKENNSSAAD